MEEHHDLLDLLLLLPCFGDPASTVHTNSGYFQQAFRTLLNDCKGIFLELSDDSLGKFGTNALDHARTEIPLNTGNGGWQSLLADFRFELDSVLGMPVPLSLQTKMFPG